MNTIDNLMALAAEYATLTADTAAITKAREALVEALAQPAQPEWNDENVIAWCVARGIKEAQPAREPLSDEQLHKFADRCTPNTETGSLNYRNFARAIERAHGIGGDK